MAYGSVGLLLNLCVYLFPACSHLLLARSCDRSCLKGVATIFRELLHVHIEISIIKATSPFQILLLCSDPVTCCFVSTGQIFWSFYVSQSRRQKTPTLAFIMLHKHWISSVASYLFKFYVQCG